MVLIKSCWQSVRDIQERRTKSASEFWHNSLKRRQGRAKQTSHVPDHEILEAPSRSAEDNLGLLVALGFDPKAKLVFFRVAKKA
jgi:hypothetical protein